MLSFFFEDKRKCFLTKLSLERNSTLLSSRRSAWPVWNQPRQRSFKRNFRYILYCMFKEGKFLKGNYCICKGFIDVSCIWHRRERKTTKCAPFWNWFYCGRQEETAILIFRLLLRTLRTYVSSFVWTSTKNEWNVSKAICDNARHL